MKKKNLKNLRKSLVLGAMILMVCPTSAWALTKHETVYSKLNYDGTINHTIVNNKLVNLEKSDTIEDYTLLKDILNLSNDNEYKVVQDHITWNCKGKDVFYQGTVTNDLPIQVKINYYLNDEEMNIDDMIGKSGHVKIILKYSNTDKHNVKINGKNQYLYTPFMVTAGTILDDSYTNISVSNGKVINNGTKNIIVGIAMPGIYESLNVKSLKGMDTITLDFDTDKFELASIYSMVMPKVISREDLNFLDDIDKLYSKVNDLQTGINKIQDGVKELAKNGDTLDNGVKQISDNLNLVANKFKDLQNGTVSLYDGVTEILKELEKAQDLFSSDSTSLSSIKELKAGNDSAISQLQKANAYLQSSVTAIDPNIDLNTIDLSNITDTTLLQTLTQLKTQYDANNKIIYLLEQNQKYISTSSALLTSAQSQIGPLVSELIDGLKSIQKGTKELMNGSSTMEEALTTLASKSMELKTGMSAYNKGVKTLESGVITYNRNGITKITSIVNNDLKTTSKKVEALIKLGEEYETFSGNIKGTQSETKFVLVVDGKKAPKEEVKTTNNNSKPSLFQRIKNLFK